LTGVSASVILPLVLVEVSTAVLGVKSVITLHVAVGLVLIGPIERQEPGATASHAQNDQRTL
jgi:hypothetical protein